ncbi:hypothetical protein NE645_17075, partial [Roseburia hominis]|nr:hypothetical protein [Roseburia hominis]
NESFKYMKNTYPNGRLIVVIAAAGGKAESRRKRHLDAKLSTPGAMGEKGVDLSETAEFEVNNEEEVTIPETRELIDGSKEHLKP